MCNTNSFKLKLSWLHVCVEKKVVSPFYFFFFFNSGVLIYILTDGANRPKCYYEWIQRTNFFFLFKCISEC